MKWESGAPSDAPGAGSPKRPPPHTSEVRILLGRPAGAAAPPERKRKKQPEAAYSCVELLKRCSQRFCPCVVVKAGAARPGCSARLTCPRLTPRANKRRRLQWRS
eukprot:25451-Alexandrium_andersonii.AAC.1